jgi:pilus assembly protein CpaD
MTGGSGDMMRATDKKAAGGTTLRQGLLRLMAACAIVSALAGCKTSEDPTRVAGWTLVDAAQRHPILVSQEPTTLPVRVRPGASGLTPAQRAQMLEFAVHYRATDAGDSRLVIAAPSGGANEVAAMYAVGEIRALLTDQGFGEAAISVEAYDAEGAHEPPIQVSYLRYVAQPPECGDWSTNLAYEPMNLPYPNFGCATQRNFGAQVANPADLLGPRSQTARSSERRDQTWQKYIKGEPTGTKRTLDDAVNTSSN